MFDFLAKLFVWPLTFFYEITGNYLISIMMITVLVMAVTTPLTLKSTKGMLEMQRLQPEMRRLQQLHRGDRQTLNQEMMKLYQEHKVNPLASCIPLLLQMPVFIGMFTLLRGLTQNIDPQTGYFLPKFVKQSSALYQDLSHSSEMVSFGLDLSKTPVYMVQNEPMMGVLYVGFVVLLGFLYWFQQRMIANRSATATMSATQAKIMQYLPVAFAPLNLFFQLGLVMYYLTSTVLRIGQQTYITRRFYHGDHSLGRQAQAASKEARDITSNDKRSPGAKSAPSKTGPSKAGTSRPAPSAKTGPTSSKPVPPKSTSWAVTPPKGKPTPTGRVAKAQPAKAQPAKPLPKASAGASKPRPTKPVKPVKPVKPDKPTSN